jgi:hypothetical protein
MALAELQHNCPGLETKCIEFIAGRSAQKLDAVVFGNTRYRHLEACMAKRAARSGMAWH